MTSIASNAFTANRLLTEIHIPEGITIIGQYAFTECTEAKVVTFPTTLTTIRSSAFYRCYGIEDISTLEFTNLRETDDDVFLDCVKIKKVVLPETLIKLGGTSRGMVFRGCSSLSKIIIKSKNLMQLGQGNFCGCSQLKSAGPIGSDCNVEFA